MRLSPSINSALFFLKDPLHYLWALSQQIIIWLFGVYIQDLNLVPGDGERLVFGLTLAHGAVISRGALLISV